MLTKPSAKLTLFDTLSRLTFSRAAKLLGPKGNRLIATGGKFDIDLAAQVKFDRDMFRLTLDGAAVTLTLSPAARHRLEWRCDAVRLARGRIGPDLLTVQRREPSACATSASSLTLSGGGRAGFSRIS